MRGIAREWIPGEREGNVSLPLAPVAGGEGGGGFEEVKKTLGRCSKSLQQCYKLLQSKRPSNFSVTSVRNRRQSAVGCCPFVVDESVNS